MKLRTEIQLAPVDLTLSHRDKIMLMGSCFVENISEQLRMSGFSPDLNPFGICYNPASLAFGLYALLQRKVYAFSDLVECQGMYHSLAHHGRFSSPDPEKCLEEINRRMGSSSAALKEANMLIVTFGTAYVYRLKSDGSMVSNCHQLPDSLFVRTRLQLDEIVNEWTDLLGKIMEVNPELNILFTVSPIRHWKDGAHGNQLSKAVLLLAMDELIAKHSNCHYFPAYELLLDDLRDYRFYAEDLIHPSPLAVDYIWGKFSSLYFSEKTQHLIVEWREIQNALNHRPLNPGSQTYQSFLERTKKRLDEFCMKYPEFT